MRRRALLCLAGWLAAGTAACAGTGAGTAAPPRASPTPPARAATAAGPSGQTATALATGYYRAVAARDYRLAFTYLAADATGPEGQVLTLPAFLQLADTMDSEAGPVVSSSAAAFGDLVVMTNNREKSGPYHAHLRIARAADRWAIVSIDRI